MTYALSWPLQAAIYSTLRADPDITAEIGDRVFDASPGETPEASDAVAYLLIGEEDVAPWTTSTDRGAIHTVTLSAVAGSEGFAALKRLAAAACDVALGPLSLARGRVASSDFLGGRARRLEGGRRRRIDLRFRFALEDDA